LRRSSRLMLAWLRRKRRGISLSQDPRWMYFGHKKTSLIC